MQDLTFGEHIRKLRKEHKLALRELAGYLDIDPSTLSKIERNEVVPPLRLIKPLSKRFNIDFESLQTHYLSEKIFNELKQIAFGIQALEIAKEKLKQSKSTQAQHEFRTKLSDKISQYFKEKPIAKAWLFGSFARGEENRESDIDLLVRYEKNHSLDLFDYIEMKHDLEALTGREVDLVEEGQELPHTKSFIYNDRQLIYEKQTRPDRKA